MVNPIVAVSLEFRLESTRSSRLYWESLRESRLLPSPISDRSRDLVIVQMKSDSAIIFTRGPVTFACRRVSHRDAMSMIWPSLEIIITDSLVTTPIIRSGRTLSLLLERDSFFHSFFHSFVLLRANLITCHEAMMKSLLVRIAMDKWNQVLFHELFVSFVFIQTFPSQNALNYYGYGFPNSSHMSGAS